MVELFQFKKPTPAAMAEDRPVIDRGITHICFDVTDVDAEYRRLSREGVIFHCEPQDLGPRLSNDLCPGPGRECRGIPGTVLAPTNHIGTNVHG